MPRIILISITKVFWETALNYVPKPFKVIFITAVPRKLLTIEKEVKIISLPLFGFVYWLKKRNIINYSIQDFNDTLFLKIAALFIKRSDILITNSGNLWQIGRRINLTTKIIHHGSLHELYERQLMMKYKLGKNERYNWNNDFLIQRQSLDFSIADQIIVNSRVALNSFSSFESEEIINKIKAIPPSINKDFSSKEKIKSWEERESFLFVGGLNPRKGLLELLDVIERKKIKFTLIGNGNSKEINQRIHNLKGKNLINHYKTLTKKELSKFYNSHKFLILPSVADGFGMVVIEAMSQGCVPVISKNTGASDLIKTGFNGFVINEPVYLQKKLMFLQKSINKSEWQVLSQNARKSIPKWDNFWRELLEFYE